MFVEQPRLHRFCELEPPYGNSTQLYLKIHPLVHFLIYIALTYDKIKQFPNFFLVHFVQQSVKVKAL